MRCILDFIVLLSLGTNETRMMYVKFPVYECNSGKSNILVHTDVTGLWSYRNLATVVPRVEQIRNPWLNLASLWTWPSIQNYWWIAPSNYWLLVPTRYLLLWASWQYKYLQYFMITYTSNLVKCICLIIRYLEILLDRITPTDVLYTPTDTVSLVL